MKFPSSIKTIDFSEASIFPNPTNGFLNIKFKQSITSGYCWKICNLQGKAIISGKTEGNMKLDLTGLPSGIYLLDLPGLIKPSRFLLQP
jgi:hypothetical protein